MGFNRISRTGEVFITEVFDSNGNKLAKWTCNKDDYPNVFNILSDKFGIGAKAVRREQQPKKEDTDLDWLK